jgi:hypothetical protein
MASRLPRHAAVGDGVLGLALRLVCLALVGCGPIQYVEVLPSGPMPVEVVLVNPSWGVSVTLHDSEGNTLFRCPSIERDDSNVRCAPVGPHRVTWEGVELVIAASTAGAAFTSRALRLDGSERMIRLRVRGEGPSLDVQVLRGFAAPARVELTTLRCEGDEDELCPRIRNEGDEPFSAAQTSDDAERSVAFVWGELQRWDAELGWVTPSKPVGSVVSRQRNAPLCLSGVTVESRPLAPGESASVWFVNRAPIERGERYRLVVFLPREEAETFWLVTRELTAR